MCKKLVENNLPKNIKVRVHYYHPHNSTPRLRKGHDYLTAVNLVDVKNHQIIASGESYCSHRDTPRRDIGRYVAVGRAMKNGGFTRHG